MHISGFVFFIWITKVRETQLLAGADISARKNNHERFKLIRLVNINRVDPAIWVAAVILKRRQERLSCWHTCQKKRKVPTKNRVNYFRVTRVMN